MKRLNEVLQNKGENYIFPFFWQHGEEESVLREYMQVIRNANIGAVCVESRPHPDFAGEKWWTDMDVILDEARKLDMKVWILDDSHFPTGFANGAVKTAPKELQHKYMCYRTLEMAGPVSQAEFELQEYMRPTPPPPWIPTPPPVDDDFADDRLIKILACPILEGEEVGEAIDLTDCVENGIVTFDLPDGYFKIFVVYITRNGKGRNDYINFLDKESCRLLIDAVYEPHYEHYKEYFGNVIAGFFSDEPPIGNVEGYMPVGPIGTPGEVLPWSKYAMERFTKAYGSEGWMKSLAMLWNDGADKAEQAKVRNACMEMVTTLVAECFSIQIGEWCRKHGVEYIGHMLEDCDMNTNMGASMGHFFRGLSGQHMAGVDNIGGQVTISGQNVTRHEKGVCRDEAGFYQYMLGKLGASHAAIDPKKKGRCLCENFGAYGWQSGPKEEKYMMDHFMVRGVNRYVPHAFTPAPFPDPDCPPHFYAHGENPTYRAFGKLMAYSNRVCHLIDGGVPHPDVAVLYNAETVWAGDAESDIPVCRYLSQAQVDFHILPSDVWADTDEYPCEFDGIVLKVNKVEYRALVLPGCTYVDPETAGFLKAAVESSFPVIFTGKKPVGVVYADETENEAFRTLIRGCVLVPVEEVGAWFRTAKPIRFQATAEPAHKLLTTSHYELDGVDEFFLLNEMAGQTYEGTLTVKAGGKAVRYYPWENRLETLEVKEHANGEKSIAISVAPLELAVILFLDEKDELLLQAEAPAVRGAAAAELLELSVGKVESKTYFHAMAEGGIEAAEPETVETVQTPLCGMQKANPDFSGIYVYETEVELERGEAYELAIDQVYETAEVFVNGESIGTRVQAPYTFRIPAPLVREKNRIRIDVATLAERIVRALGAGVNAMSAYRPFCPTGILGGVKIYKTGRNFYEC